MPIYRYRCSRCGTEFRELRGVQDRALVRCPGCGASEVTRLLPRFGVVYKGSGFYTTDYRRARSGGASSEGSTDGE
ncbi:MAG TPA: zinc ribbon domain-containing protein [Candidatus Bipolaricaulis sp.]|nr:zinc ribbon domain-containing protein [Candidatus Bipolaricaulis sp.]MDY0393059.1 zinc ribbon domain-containing protein [Candidatus Bipolaricaulis sp.]HPD07146.1 zinc ribbon domain-containing protein [Candidatus Bipolaricaulis sp.]HRS13584.1 zinc ribbon domain-containing protein [Candidatus Bipolaricaulis sp.]HRU21986.1 zinc ribbon domain-containing protein [Candidatus Bipolaricaulis sp.]